MKKNFNQQRNDNQNVTACHLINFTIKAFYAMKTLGGECGSHGPVNIRENMTKNSSLVTVCFLLLLLLLKGV